MNDPNRVIVGHRFLVAFSACVIATVLGCSGGRRPPAASPSKPTTAPAAASAATPADMSPNVERDRRNEAGVRAPPKKLVLGRAKAAVCGKIAGPDAGTASELLAGRLRVNAPAGAKPVAPPVAEAKANEEETRLVVEVGSNADKEALAIVARETFQLDPDRFEAEADAPAKPGSLDVEASKFLKATFREEEGLDIAPVEIGTDAKVRAYAARPRRPSAPAGKDTALVLALLVAHPDGTLQSVAFYVRGEHVRGVPGKELVGCTRVAERIAATLAPGPRAIERTAGARRVADVSNDEELTITLPGDYIVVPLATGARVHKLKPLSLYPGSITISLGNEADKHAPREAETTIDGKLLGRATQWRGKKADNGGVLFAAEPIDAKDKGKPGARSAEVVVKASRQARILDEFRGVAETLTVGKRAPNAK